MVTLAQSVGRVSDVFVSFDGIKQLKFIWDEICLYIISQFLATSDEVIIHMKVHGEHDHIIHITIYWAIECGNLYCAQ